MASILSRPQCVKGFLLLYFRHALSDGFIHCFFYVYRYFASPLELFDFLRDKYTAASLSLSPEADIPVKVKARSLHLLQAWIEGYFSVDFKHDSHLTAQLYNFIKEKVGMVALYTVMSWYGDAYCITGTLWGESTRYWWIPPTKDQLCRAWMVSLLLAWIIVEQTVRLQVIWNAVTCDIDVMC